jgi:hypothetical protein
MNDGNDETSQTGVAENPAAVRYLCRPPPSVYRYTKMSMQMFSQSDDGSAILTCGNIHLASVGSAWLHPGALFRAARDWTAVESAC